VNRVLHLGLAQVPQDASAVTSRLGIGNPVDAFPRRMREPVDDAEAAEDEFVEVASLDQG
jgi:hypothetical protein